MITDPPTEPAGGPHLTVVQDVGGRFLLACSILRWHANLRGTACSLNMAVAWGQAEYTVQVRGKT